MQYAKKPVILISLVLLGPTHTLNLLKFQPPKSSLAALVLLCPSRLPYLKSQSFLVAIVLFSSSLKKAFIRLQKVSGPTRKVDTPSLPRKLIRLLVPLYANLLRYLVEDHCCSWSKYTDSCLLSGLGSIWVVSRYTLVPRNFFSLKMF